MRIVSRFVLFIMLLCSFAQAAPLSKMYGQVFHQNGRPAANVTLKVVGGGETKANGMGIYSIAVSPGKHTVAIGSTKISVRIFNKPRNRRDFRIP